MKSHSAFAPSAVFCTMQPPSAPYPRTVSYSRAACSSGVSQKGTCCGSKVRVAATCRASASMASTSPMIWTMSLMSPFSGISGQASFRSTSRTRFAVPRSCRATCQLCSCPVYPFPAPSQSGRMITSAPARIRLWPSRHFPAPPGLHVAQNPSRASVSASFSPSTTYTGRPSAIARTTSGIRYSVESRISAGTEFTYPSRVIRVLPSRFCSSVARARCRKVFPGFPSR